MIYLDILVKNILVKNIANMVSFLQLAIPVNLVLYGLYERFLKKQGVEEFENTGAPVYLSADDLTHEVRIKGATKPGTLLIMADWCGHCQRFKPVYEQAASLLKDSATLYVIKDTDLENRPDIQRALSFRGFPTVKYVDSTGKVLGDYEKGRDLNTFVSSVKGHCQRHG
jgi:thiol-disulfide isomerase/thioredoxin